MNQAIAEPEVEKLMTSEEFESLPDDGVERWIIRGKLYENRDTDMTRRNRYHASTEWLISGQLHAWWLNQPQPRGMFAAGEVGIRLSTNPVVIVGADIAYFSNTVALANPKNSQLFDGAPILAVEILSPYDKIQDILDKTNAYLDNGTELVWIVDPYNQTVAIHRLNTPVVTFNNTHKLENLPELPGFSVDVADLFQ